MSTSHRNGIFKGHALGIDYIVRDLANLDIRLNPKTGQIDELSR